MAGKSTYLKQAAVIALMAQIGSFVPAAKAEIGICDRIFTRIGAHEDLSLVNHLHGGDERAGHILHHATHRSLVLLDEVGRGTSTYDGLSIAWAVAEQLETARRPANQSSPPTTMS